MSMSTQLAHCTATKSLHRYSISELSTKKIAQHNITLVQNTAANPYALYKALRQTPDSTDNDKLFDYQNMS